MGALRFNGEKPSVGTKVLVVVEAGNHPIGIWDGELTGVYGDDNPVESLGVRQLGCRAQITDPRAPWKGEAYLHYTVYVATNGTDYLRKRLADTNEEVRGLQRRIKIERDSWHAMLKAIVNTDALDRFEGILTEFLARLGR